MVKTAKPDVCRSSQGECYDLSARTTLGNKKKYTTMSKLVRSSKMGNKICHRTFGLTCCPPYSKCIVLILNPVKE